MPHSLRAKIKGLRYKGIITDKDCNRLRKALDNEDVLDKVRAEIENDWQLKEYPNSPFSCGLRRAIEIIDKHMAKEDKESAQIDETEAYKAGLEAAWELARKLSNLGFNDRRKEIFGEKYGLSIDIIKNFSVDEVAAKIKEYEEKQKRNCDTCKYGGHTLQDLKKCVYCDGRNGWTPKMTLDEAIKHAEEVADTPCFTDEEAKCYSEHRQLAEWLKELKAYRAEGSGQKSDWIPCSKRLPNKDKYTDFYKCLVAMRCTSRNDICDTVTAYFDGKHFYRHLYDAVFISGVEAWMPLPEPYKAESEE